MLDMLVFIITIIGLAALTGAVLATDLLYRAINIVQFRGGGSVIALCIIITLVFADCTGIL